MATKSRRRKRALDVDRDEPVVHSLRQALASRKMSVGVLRSILQLAQETPEIASTKLEHITAISSSMFETVRHVETIPPQNGPDFNWEMC